jgi:hypothetical protein
MDLILSRDSATNTIISSNGIPLYKIHTPSSLLEWNTTISRISKSSSSTTTPQSNSNIYSSSESPTSSSEHLIPSNTKPSLSPLIHIRWHLVSTTKLRFTSTSNGSHEMNLDEYMGTGGFLGRYVATTCIDNGTSI